MMEILHEFRYSAITGWHPADDTNAWDRLRHTAGVETRTVAVLPAARPVPEIAEHRRAEKSPQELWESFWSDIVVKDGQVDVEQVKLELADFAMILDWTAKVYEHATAGEISSPNTWPSVVKAVIDDNINRLCREAEVDVLKVIRDDVAGQVSPDTAALLKRIDEMLESRNDKAR